MDGRIDLERARREAKALLRAAREGDAGALGRLRADREPRLADAQRAVALELGAPSWPALVRRVEEELVERLLEGDEVALGSAGPRVAGRALLRAAREGREDAVYRLLAGGVDAGARDPQSGETALHVAAAMGRLDVVGVLVGWVHVDRFARDAAGATALDACVRGAGDLAVAKVLVSCGLRTDLDLVDRTPGALADWLREAPERTISLDAERGEAAWAADAALFELLASSPLAERRRVGDGFAFRTGLFDNTRNGVVCSELGDEDLGEVLGWLGAPAQWLVGPDSELGPRLERAGCRPERSSVFMAAELAGLALDGGGVEIAPIRDERVLAETFDATGGLDGEPGEPELLASLGLDEGRPLQHYAAWRDGKPVGLASAFAAGATLSGINLAVAPAARRGGIGRALVAHVLREGSARGCTRAVLGPTPATVPFYEALGFTLLRFPPDRAFYTPFA
jgi:GNAT superfamily N-acetyltransferase